MILRHLGLTSSSEEKADAFYADLLGLIKSEPKLLSLELSKAIFRVDRELLMINYQDQNIHFEIFITGLHTDNSRKIEHACLEVGNLEEFLEKCRRLSIDISRIPKGDKTLTFIRDFDGNFFEIKGGQGLRD